MRSYQIFFFAVLLFGGVLASSLTVSAFLLADNRGGETTPDVHVSVERGESVKDIARTLYDAHLIRSKAWFEFYAFISGRAHRLKPGDYLLRPGQSTSQIISALVAGPTNEVEVTIPEGYTLWDIDAELGSAGVLATGTLVKLDKKMPGVLEGYLFPDTYRFYLNASATEVVAKMTENFNVKARPLLDAVSRGDKKKFQYFLVVASLLEKEVPDGEDRRIVAGIIEKRLAARMPLQIDATICYIKEKRSQTCESVRALDLKIDSPYNTYLHTGLPPAPISNPGLDAIKASMSPKESPYWYYLSDPKTKKTIFSKTLEEHGENRAKYLKK